MIRYLLSSIITDMIFAKKKQYFFFYGNIHQDGDIWTSFASNGLIAFAKNNTNSEICQIILPETFSLETSRITFEKYNFKEEDAQMFHHQNHGLKQMWFRSWTRHKRSLRKIKK